MQQPLTIDRNFIRVGISGLIGSIFEWYDFTVFIFLAPIISQLFFPHKNPYISILQVYGVFALGYLIRPVGGAILGHFGDRIGRRKILVFSILIMTFATVLIGVLPTYQQAGIWGPVGLIFLRMVQGMSTAGESIGAMTLTFELAPLKYRGVTSTSIWVGSGVGIVLASLLVGFMTGHISRENMESWGWRIPFFVGFLTGIFGYLIRHQAIESVYFAAMVKRGEVFRFPVIEIFKKYKKEFLKVFLIIVPHEVNFYVFFVFLPTYSANFLGHLPEALLINGITMSYIFVLGPILAYVSDRIGRKPFLIVALLSIILLSVTLFDLVATGSLRNFFIAQSIFAIIHCIYAGAVFSASLEAVPTKVRYSILALSYNLGYAVFGGTAPLIATYLIHRNKSLIVPAFYIIALAVLALLAVLTMRETHKEVVL